MFHRVVKQAFDAVFIAEVERAARPLDVMAGAVVENSPYDTRQCELRWIRNGTREFARLEKQILGLLGREGVVDPKLCVMEDLQYTEYGPGAFHDWHIDAYRRPYNMYDAALGRRFIGRKRKVSLSVLLNDARDYEGGAFEVSMFPNGRNTVGAPLDTLTEAGDVAVFDSALCHRVAPVTKGLRRSLVAWVCG